MQENTSCSFPLRRKNQKGPHSPPPQCGGQGSESLALGCECSRGRPRWGSQSSSPRRAAGRAWAQTDAGAQVGGRMRERRCTRSTPARKPAVSQADATLTGTNPRGRATFVFPGEKLSSSIWSAGPIRIQTPGAGTTLYPCLQTEAEDLGPLNNQRKQHQGPNPCWFFAPASTDSGDCPSLLLTFQESLLLSYKVPPGAGLLLLLPTQQTFSWPKRPDLVGGSHGDHGRAGFLLLRFGAQTPSWAKPAPSPA